MLLAFGKSPAKHKYLQGIWLAECKKPSCSWTKNCCFLSTGCPSGGRFQEIAFLEFHLEGIGCKTPCKVCVQTLFQKDACGKGQFASMTSMTQSAGDRTTEIRKCHVVPIMHPLVSPCLKLILIGRLETKELYPWVSLGGQENARTRPIPSEARNSFTQKCFKRVWSKQWGVTGRPTGHLNGSSPSRKG